MAIVGIYKLTSPHGKVYIGQSHDIKQRFALHKSNGHQHKTKLGNCINKYGFLSFAKEIIHELPSDVDQRILDAYECLYMEAYTTAGKTLLNTKHGGSRGKLSSDQIARLSLIKKGNTNMLGKRHSQETREAISNAHKGKTHGLEARQKISKARLGITLSDSHKTNIAFGGMGSKRSDETKSKMSSWQKQVKKPIHTVNKTKATKEKNKSAVVFDTISQQTIISVTAAAKSFGVHRATMSKYLNNQEINPTHFILKFT